MKNVIITALSCALLALLVMGATQTHITNIDSRHGTLDISPGNPNQQVTFDEPFPAGATYDVFVEVHTTTGQAMAFPITDKTESGFIVRILGNPTTAAGQWRAFARP